MKKLIFLSVLCVLVFVAGNAKAVLMGDGTYVGGTSECVGCFQPHLDSLENVNFVLTAYNTNTKYTSDLPSPILLPYVAVEIPGEGPRSGAIDISGFEYISLKWARVFGLWYVGDIDTTFNFAGLSHGLSHYRKWNPTSVPEPATMLLLGLGLVGLAGYGRRKFKNN